MTPAGKSACVHVQRHERQAPDRHCHLGYLWDEKREHWFVDEEAAEVARRIFSLTMEGYGPYQISKRLSEAKVEILAVHLARSDEEVNRTKLVKDPYQH